MGAIAKTASSPLGMALNPVTGLPIAEGKLADGATGLGKKIAGSPLGSLLGQAGGALGTGFAKPELANIQQGTSAQDVQNAQTSAGNSLASQNALLSALQGQNGLGQQNAVAQQQNALNSQLNAANGIGTQNAAIQGLQGAANQYQNIANGTGPNIARSMLNQATGQNVANQAALMAGQRGAGANVGLMARQAAQQGANTQQQAVGQGATMQAQQQVNALAGLTGANQAMGGLGTSQLGAQQAQQQAMANQANTIANQQIAGTTANTQANLSNQQQMQGALQGINNANISNQGNVNAANAGLAQTQLKGQQDIAGGLMSGAGGALGLAGGGEVKMADGGSAPQIPLVQPVTPQQLFSAGPQAPGPTSSFGQFMSGWAEPKEDGAPSVADKPTETALPKADTGEDKLQKGSKDLSQGLMLAAMAAKGGLAKGGGHVAAKSPAQRAVKGGDSYSNDKIPAKLSEGEIVLPRSVTMSGDPIRDSADFVRKVLAKRKTK